jgi:SAM-dependent methyltransferase
MTSNESLADLIAGHYERHASDWDAERRALPWVDRPWIDFFAGLLPAGGNVLDLGCGGGDPVATALAAHGMNITGVDVCVCAYWDFGCAKRRSWWKDRRTAHPTWRSSGRPGIPAPDPRSDYCR